MVGFTCKHCNNRRLGCHATCETYINEKEKHDKLIQCNKQPTYHLNSNGTYYSGKGHHK